MNTINTNDVAASKNKTTTIFTDWLQLPVEYVTERPDEHTARVYGKWEGIDVCVTIDDIYVGVGITVVITDAQRRGISVVSGVSIDSADFNNCGHHSPFESVVIAVQKATEQVLTYASLYKNENGVSIKRLEESLRLFSNGFTGALFFRLTEGANISSVADKASLVVA